MMTNTLDTIMTAIAGLTILGFLALLIIGPLAARARAKRNREFQQSMEESRSLLRQLAQRLKDGER